MALINYDPNAGQLSQDEQMGMFWLNFFFNPGSHISNLMGGIGEGTNSLSDSVGYGLNSIGLQGLLPGLSEQLVTMTNPLGSNLGNFAMFGAVVFVVIILIILIFRE